MFLPEVIPPEPSELFPGDNDDDDNDDDNASQSSFVTAVEDCNLQEDKLGPMLDAILSQTQPRVVKVLLENLIRSGLFRKATQTQVEPTFKHCLDVDSSILSLSILSEMYKMIANEDEQSTTFSDQPDEYITVIKVLLGIPAPNVGNPESSVGMPDPEDVGTSDGPLDDGKVDDGKTATIKTVVTANDSLAGKKSATIADNTSNTTVADNTSNNTTNVNMTNFNMTNVNTSNVTDNASTNEQAKMVSISQDAGGASTPGTKQKVTVATNINPRIKDIFGELFGFSLMLSDRIHRQANSPGSKLEISEITTLLEEEAESVMKILDRQVHRQPSNEHAKGRKAFPMSNKKKLRKHLFNGKYLKKQDALMLYEILKGVEAHIGETFFKTTKKARGGLTRDEMIILLETMGGACIHHKATKLEILAAMAKARKKAMAESPDLFRSPDLFHSNDRTTDFSGGMTESPSSSSEPLTLVFQD